jgi:hypothetical protein
MKQTTTIQNRNLYRHCERSEAIQTEHSKIPDCFVPRNNVVCINSPFEGGKGDVQKGKRQTDIPLPPAKGEFSILHSPFSIALFGLIFLLSSCAREIEIPDKPDSGKKVAVRFLLGDVTYKGHEVVTRSRTDMNPATVVIPLQDNLYMHATLEADNPVGLRAGTNPLPENTKVRIAAYLNGAGNAVAVADYTVTATGELSGSDMQVSVGSSYRFAAWSYNSDAPLPTPHTETIPAGNFEDLLWGVFPESSTHQITATPQPITLTMSHAFSQVKIEATTASLSGTPAIADIGNVTIPGKKAEMTVRDGALTPQGDIVQNFSWPALHATAVTSDARIVYTGEDASTTVRIGSLELFGYAPFTNLPDAIFPKQLQPGVSYTLKVHFRNSGDIENEGAGTPPAGGITYVGAFWRAGETGERIIRIYAGAYPAGYGAWRATVMWMDGRWGGGDGVLLDTDMLDVASLNNRGVSFTSDMTPDDAELYPVTGNIAAGTVDASNRYIMFRIGLKTQYQPSEPHPVRYAVVLLSYANNTKHQKIFLRQGENADYLYTNNDPVSGALSVRTATKRFLPYNLTVPAWDNQDYINVSGRQGVLTDYPTKTGAFWYWVFSINVGNRALKPHTTAASGAITVPTAHWNMMAPTNENCPPGYRRPVDGLGLDNIHDDGANISGSEIRQSLFVHPRAGYNFNIIEDNNSMYGYYADGFFDRRWPADGTAIVNTTVAGKTPDIAHAGMLFFNALPGSERYNASLFFPCSGFRHTLNGTLIESGAQGMYWTSTTSIMNSYFGASELRFSPGNAGLWNTEKNTGATIRCVRDF